MTTTEATDVALLADMIEHLDPEDIVALGVEPALILYAILEDANRSLQALRSDLVRLLAPAMPEKQVTVQGAGTFVRHVKKDRRKWDTDSLSRLVLDSRIVNTETGEVRDETPVDKIKHVWNLGAPRVTALRERGIDPEEFCESEWGGYTIEVLT